MFWITPIISIYQRSQEKLIWHQKCSRKKRLPEKNIKRERDDNNIFFLNLDINLNKRLRVFTPSTQTKKKLN